MAMLLLLGLIGGANSTLLVSSINTLLIYLQVNSSLLFKSNDTIAFIYLSANKMEHSCTDNIHVQIVRSDIDQ